MSGSSFDMYRLPQELFDYITDFLQEDTLALRTCALVCDPLRLAARRHQFGKVKLCLPMSAFSASSELRPLAKCTFAKFHSLILGTPFIARSVFSLEVYFGRPERDQDPSSLSKELGTLSNILVLLQRLDRLTMSGGTRGRLHSASMLPELSPLLDNYLGKCSLSEFTMDGVDSLNLSAETVEKWVSLKRLRIICSGAGTFTDTNLFASHGLQFPNLRSLVLAGIDVYQALDTMLCQGSALDPPYNILNLDHLGLVVNYLTEHVISQKILRVAGPNLRSLTVDLVLMDEDVPPLDLGSFPHLTHLHFVCAMYGYASGIIPICRFAKALETIDMEVIVSGDPDKQQWGKLDTVFAGLERLQRVNVRIHERYEECDQYECLCASDATEEMMAAAESGMPATRARGIMNISSKRYRTVWGGVPML